METRLVWITLLAMADRRGRIFASIPGLANRARVPLEATEKAIETFLAPDRYSRTPDHDGRRIEPIDGGWRLLNHGKYRDLRDEVSRREYMRGYMNERRKQEKLTVNPVSRQLAQAEAEADTDKKTKARVAALPAWLPQEPWKAWLEVRTKKKVPNTARALELAIAELDRLRQQGQDPSAILEAAILKGWRGIFPLPVAVASAPPPGTRPSITCSTCKQRAFTWTAGQCDPCWRKSQGMAA